MLNESKWEACAIVQVTEQEKQMLFFYSSVSGDHPFIYHDRLKDWKMVVASGSQMWSQTCLTHVYVYLNMYSSKWPAGSTSSGGKKTCNSEKTAISLLALWPKHSADDLCVHLPVLSLADKIKFIL